MAYTQSRTTNIYMAGLFVTVVVLLWIGVIITLVMR